MRKLAFLPILLLLASPLQPEQPRPPEAAAVLSSASGYYLDTYHAFRAAYPGEVHLYDLSKGQVPADAGLVVAFGGLAASYGGYDQRARLVYCLAPGLPAPRSRRAQAVAMVPEPASVPAAVLSLQPDLRRLAVLWASADYGAYVSSVAAAAGPGLEVVAVRVEDPDGLPAALRGLRGAGAVWLLPDPVLVTQDTFKLLHDFARGNKLPFYAPTENLARDGDPPAAALYVNFTDIGRAAAAAAAGGAGRSVIYPGKARLYVNREEAAFFGLKAPPAQAD